MSKSFKNNKLINISELAKEIGLENIKKKVNYLRILCVFGRANLNKLGQLYYS